MAITQVIGKGLPNGFAGWYAYQPDLVIKTRPAGGDTPFPFGTALKYASGNTGAVVPMGAGDAATAFVGVACYEVKTPVSYADQGVGMYAPNDAVAVFMRGAVNVKVQKGTPALGGTVYVRVAANASYPTAAVGGFEAEADGNNTVALTGVQFEGAADANGVAAIRILYMQKA